MTATSLSPNYFATADGFRIAWYELGSANAGPPIILQHGFSATTFSEWVECGIAKSLGGLGRRVIGIDALGHGGSDHPHESSHYGEARFARDISDLATALGIERFDLVGYSMGAIVALLVGVLEPRLRRLIVGGVGEGVVVCGGVDRRALDPRVVAEALAADDAPGANEWVIGLRQGAEQRGNDLMALAAAVSVAHATPIPLDRIAVPTMLVAGDSDPLAIHPERLQQAILDCRLVIVPGDHTEARLSRQFTAALLDFLA